MPFVARACATVLLVVLAHLGACRRPSSTPQPGTEARPEPDARSGGVGGGPAQAPRPAARPKTREACAACNGSWGRHGLSEVESCLCRTKDGGRPCRDGADCEGLCLVGDDAKLEVVDPGPPARGFFVGRCSEYEGVFGCLRVISRGVRDRGPQPAERAVDEMCID